MKQSVQTAQLARTAQDAASVINDKEPAEREREADCGTLECGFVFSLGKGQRKGILENHAHFKKV